MFFDLDGDGISEFQFAVNKNAVTNRVTHPKNVSQHIFSTAKLCGNLCAALHAKCGLQGLKRLVIFVRKE